MTNDQERVSELMPSQKQKAEAYEWFCGLISRLQGDQYATTDGINAAITIKQLLISRTPREKAAPEDGEVRAIYAGHDYAERADFYFKKVKDEAVKIGDNDLLGYLNNLKWNMTQAIRAAASSGKEK